MHALLDPYSKAGLRLRYPTIPSSPAGMGIQNLAPYDRIDPTVPLLPLLLLLCKLTNSTT